MRSPRIARSFALFTLVACASPGLAWASPADPPRGAADAAKPTSPDVDFEAARWLGVGNKAFKEGRFAEAERAYREAFAVKRGYDIAGNLGAAEMAQGKLREGAEHLAFTLRMFPVTGEPALREQMAKAYEQCRRGVGAVRVKVGVPGATVLVDGVPAGEAPLADEVFVEPGEHVFEARLPGYTGAPQRVIVDKGAATEVALALTALPPPPRVVVRATPVRRLRLVPGLSLSAAAVVGFAGGAVFMSLSGSKRSAARGLAMQITGNHGGSCVRGAANYDGARCPALQSALRADDAFHDVAVGALVVGSAAAVGAVAYFFWPQRAVTSGLRLTPVVGAGDGGVILSGSF